MIACERSPALPRGFSRQARLYLRPTALVAGAAAEAALAQATGRRLAGGRFVFTSCEVLLRERGRLAATLAPAAEVAVWAETLEPPTAGRLATLLTRLSAPRAPIVGVPMDRPAIMGVINVTDRALAALYRSKQIRVIYKKWFGRFAAKVPNLLKAVYKMGATPE